MSLTGLPERAQVFGPTFEVAGVIYHLQPYLLAAICARESNYGAGNTPPGPGGTGDFVARHKAAMRTDKRFKYDLERHGYIPADGLGWGRGLMQIDYEHWAGFCDSGVWMDPAQNVFFGATILRHSMLVFAQDEFLAVAAYNAGEDRVDQARTEHEASDRLELEHAINLLTTHGNYPSSVLTIRDEYLNAEDAAKPATTQRSI